MEGRYPSGARVAAGSTATESIAPPRPRASGPAPAPPRASNTVTDAGLQDWSWLSIDAAPRSTGASEEGLRIAQYEVIRELGRGGMGVVYLARDDRLGRKVALKLLQNAHPELTRRFVIEARATARCNHENIVVIHEVGEHQGSPFMVLEFLEGQPLSALLAKSSPLPPSRAVEIMTSVVRALACAHEHGIVHRDLKPDNVFLTSLGALKVLDFGIAKVLDAKPGGGRESLVRAVATEEHTTGIAGTYEYMSPEQWGVGGEIDHQTDIWASGVVLFEMLAGQHPFALLGRAPQFWVRELELPVPSLAEVAPHVPAELAAVVDRCLRKRKAERWPDANALLRALEPLLPNRHATGPSLERKPYAGLRAFQEEDAGRFFGRARDIAALAARVRDYSLTAVVGPSGIGKSSLLRAGVVPALKASGENWEALATRPGREPTLALAALLAPLVTTTPSLADDLGVQRELAQRLRLEPGYLGSALRAAARRSGRMLLLFVDQFEELHTLGADVAERRAFTACLSAAADDPASPVRVVLSMRSDFIGHMAEDPLFMNELGKGLVFLGAPDPSGLEEALLRPAQLEGYRFESDDMVSDMVGYLASTPGGLPLLQFTAAQLWERRDVARKLLTQGGYRQIGGISGALVSHADQVLSELTPDQQQLCQKLFLHLVTSERTRAVRGASELAEFLGQPQALEALIRHLIDARLLVVQRSPEGDSTVEIVHESLIGSWPKLRRWLEESHEDSVYLDQLLSAARQWHARRRDPGLLWRGETAEELERFQRRYRGEWPETGRAFVSAILGERTKAGKRRRRLAAAAMISMLALLTAAAVALIVISRARRAAEENAAVATLAGQRAERRLQEVQQKEAERLQAEQRRLAAEKQVKRTGEELERSNAELFDKNQQLSSALGRTEEQRRRAENAQAQAEQNESAARSAEERAKRSAQELAELLDKEKARTARLTRDLGSLVEQLK